MKKPILVLFVIVALSVISASAQISITRDDFPDIGNLVISAVDNTTTINPGQPGANQTWDFSNLSASTFDSIYYISPSAAPGYQNYPAANLATNHNPLSYPNGYNVNFWNYSTSNIKGVADESLINLFGDFYLAFHIRYIPPSANLDFPIDYGDSKSQNFVIEWLTASRMAGVTTDSAKSISHVSLNCNVDAYGLMILPDGSYPVLRVSETFNTVDSSFSWSGSSWVFDQTSTDNWTQYRWYAEDYGEVGYYSTQSKKANDFTFFKSETLVGMQDVADKNSFRIYPNPAANMIRILPADKAENIEVLDNGGRVLISVKQQAEVDVSALAPGFYSIRIINGDRIQTEKFIKN